MQLRENGKDALHHLGVSVFPRSGVSPISLFKASEFNEYSPSALPSGRLFRQAVSSLDPKT